MKFFKNTALLIAFITAKNINTLTNREKIELYNVINIIETQPNKILTLPQKNILKKYIAMDKDPFVQEKIRYLTDHLKFNIDSLKEPVPTKQTIVQQQTTATQTTAPQPTQQLQTSHITIEQKRKPLPTIPEKKALTPEIVITHQKQTPQPIKIEPTMTSDERKKKFTELETEIYRNFYYNAEEGLLTLEGIDDIVATIKKDNPTLDNTKLIDKAYNKAVDIVQEIKKQTPLNSQTKDALKNMIKNAIGQTTISSFTPTLIELQETLPMKEYHAITPTSFTSTITSVIESIDKPIEQKKAPQPLSSKLKEFVEHSKKQRAQYYSLKGLMREDWLMHAVKLIVNGTLTADKKESVKQQLFTTIDILMIAPLGDEKSIPKNEYTKIVDKLKNQITTFVDKLAVDKIYSPKK